LSAFSCRPRRSRARKMSSAPRSYGKEAR
jgi:hypothetical protein